jgi:MSHA pilin protein MshA
MMPSKSSGFTLIELVVVITILGILAAFAVPKFIALDSQARIATINGLAGSVKSAASLARGMSMATGAANVVVMEGSPVNLVNNYPDSTNNGIPMAVNTSASDFTYNPGAAQGVWSKVGAPGAAGTCAVTYIPPTVAGAAPVVTVTTTGC